MEPEAALIDVELEKQIRLLQSANDTASQGRTLAIITVLFSRCSADSHIAAAGSAIPHMAQLLTSADQVVQVILAHRVTTQTIRRCIPVSVSVSAAAITAC